MSISQHKHAVKNAQAAEPIDPQRLYSLAVTFERIDVSPATGYRKMAKGEIRAVKVGRLTKVSGAEILRLLASFSAFESRAAGAIPPSRPSSAPKEDAEALQRVSSRGSV